MDRRTSAFSILPLAALCACASPLASASVPSSPPPAIDLVRQKTFADCLNAVGGQRFVCDGIAFGGGAIVETATVDIDSDGDQDIIVRRLSSLTCGSHGCSTDIYLRTDAGWMIAEPRLVTAGPIFLCQKGGARGLKTTPGACHLFYFPIG